MKTSEFKQMIHNLGFDYEDNFYKQIEVISDKLILATVSLVEQGRFEILTSNELSRSIVEDIMEYAYTPLDERKDEIKATFSLWEINFARNMIKQLSEWDEANKFNREMDGHHHIDIIDRTDYDCFLSIMAKAGDMEVHW